MTKACKLGSKVKDLVFMSHSKARTIFVQKFQRSDIGTVVKHSPLTSEVGGSNPAPYVESW